MTIDAEFHILSYVLLYSVLVDSGTKASKWSNSCFETLDSLQSQYLCRSIRQAEPSMLIHQKAWGKQPFGEREGPKPSLKAAEERQIETNTFIRSFVYLLWKEKTGNGWHILFYFIIIIVHFTFI